jgi:hypothetical protein
MTKKTVFITKKDLLKKAVFNCSATMKEIRLKRQAEIKAVFRNLDKSEN